MSAKLGTIAVGLEPAEPHKLSDALTAAVDEEVTHVLDAACNSARQILGGQRQVMDRAVALLKEVETITAAELDAVVGAADRLEMSAS